MPESYLGFWPSSDLDDVVAGIGKLPCSLCYCREVLLLNLCLRDDRGGQHADAQFTLQPHLNLVQECLVFHGSGQVAMHGERVRGWLVSDNSTGRRRNAGGSIRIPAAACGIVGYKPSASDACAARTSPRATIAAAPP